MGLESLEIRFRTKPQVRYDWTRRFGTCIVVSNTSPAEVRYDWIPRECMGPKGNKLAKK